MCLQCTTNPWYFDGEVLPGYWLIRARRGYFDEMEPKDWGLVKCNDPSLIFKTTPYLYDDLDTLWEKYDSFYDEWYCSPDLGYDIISAFKQIKPDFRLKRLFVKYGEYYSRNIMMQLYIYLADFIQRATVYTEQDAFPNSDDCSPTDYTYNPKEP